MTSSVATDMSSSEPESLDSLDYDDWEGQFEFIGNNNNGNHSNDNNSSANHAVDSDDLNLSQHNYMPNINNGSIRIDEMTFLTMPTNSDDLDDGTQQSGYFIENALTDFEHCVPFNKTQLLNNKNCEKNNLNLHFDDIIKLKNKLNNLSGDNNNNNNNNCKLNGFSGDLCDNLTEQVRQFFTNKKKTKQNKNKHDFLDRNVFAKLNIFLFCYHAMRSKSSISKSKILGIAIIEKIYF